MRAIYIPGIETHVSIGQYVQAVKMAKENPDREFKTGITTWWPTSGRDIMRQFFAGVTDRINQAIPYIERQGGAR